jgi:hypothetical protein
MPNTHSGPKPNTARNRALVGCIAARMNSAVASVASSNPPGYIQSWWKLARNIMTMIVRIATKPPISSARAPRRVRGPAQLRHPIARAAPISTSNKRVSVARYTGHGSPL